MKIVTGINVDKNQIRKLWDDCFDEDSTEWRDWYFENIFNPQHINCIKENDELISMVHMNPYNITLRNSIVKTFAMAGVATEKNMRGKGYADNLIRYSIKKSFEKGYDFSFLYPFKYEFYEKFGYRLGYNKYTYSIGYSPVNKSKQIIIGNLFDLSKFKKIYSKFTENKNGFVIRNEEYYKIHLKELLCNDNKIICFSIGDKEGYFCIDKEIGIVDELAYEGETGEAMYAIVAHFKKDILFKNLYKCSCEEGKEEQHCMGRVISVEGILKKLKYKNADIKIEITDNIIKENNAVWHIKSHMGINKIKKTYMHPDYKIDISELVPVITGIDFQSDSKIHEIQESLFDNTMPFIYEVC